MWILKSKLDLLTMHTIWLREHNRIAYHLYNINTNWPNEKLYEEARKIVSAEMQIITYKQWLPVVLGPEGMEMVIFPLWFSNVKQILTPLLYWF